jgi:hypothetical protein
MSAESTLVFYGIREDIFADQIEELEGNSHTLIRKARSVGLHFYGGNFAEPDEKYYLFVGTKIGIVGAENAAELTVLDPVLLEMLRTTREKLLAADIPGEPRLYVQWMPDAS